MVSILDNKKIAELVIKQDGENYEKINPETLATIVEDVTKKENSEGGIVNATVQAHIDDKNIHLSEYDILQITSDKLSSEDIIAGTNITIEKDEETGDITISTTNIDVEKVLTSENLIPEDETITLTQEDEITKIRANIPDVSKFTEQRNIKAGNPNIRIEYDEESNDVTLYGTMEQYHAGNGIRISEDGEVSNSLPDRIVRLVEGENITIEGDYPTFTISSSAKAKISNWASETLYYVDDFCIYENSLFQCLEDHESEADFDTAKWRLIAGWATRRQYFSIEEEGQKTIVLNEVVPNKDTLIINIGGVVQQGHNYELNPDGQTITFVNEIPVDSLIEVIVMSNVVLDTYDNQINIHEWEANTSYAEGNITIHDDCIYQCIERHVSGEVFQKTYWKSLCGYAKKSYFYELEEDTESIVLPTSVVEENDIMINVGNTVLQSNTYSIDNTGRVIVFTEPLEAGAIVEVVVFGSASIVHPEMPSAEAHPYHMLVTNSAGSGYDLYNAGEVGNYLGFKGIDNLDTKSGHIFAVNSDETNMELINPTQLSAKIKVRNDVNGFKATVIHQQITPIGQGVSKDKNDSILFEEGSVLSYDKSVLINLTNKIQKNPNEEFGRGQESGCMIGLGQDEWTQPYMTSNTTPYGIVETSEAQTDREGWRAMDGLKETGNGWLAFNTTATWSYRLPYEFIVTSIDFRNTMSGQENHAKDIDLWVNTPNNIVASFTAIDEDYGLSHVEIPHPVTGKTFGLTIKNSYGIAVGAKEITLYASHPSYIAKNGFYNIYAISDDTGLNTEIATSSYNEEELKDYLPTGYTKYALIGTFETDNEWNICKLYPNKDMSEKYIDGSLVGELSSNKLVQYVRDVEEEKPVKIIEQWGESVPVDGVITFPEAYNKLLYVMANGVKILTKSATGFTVEPTDEEISWMAKGL